MIAAEQKKEDQQNDRGSRFEEGDSEQPLILQQHLPRLPAGRAVAAVLVLPQNLIWTAKSPEW